MSHTLTSDIQRMMAETGYTVLPPKKKSVKKPQYFIIKFPNFAEALIKCPNGWIGLNDYIKYFKDEYDDNMLFNEIKLRCSEQNIELTDDEIRDCFMDFILPVEKQILTLVVNAILVDQRT